MRITIKYLNILTFLMTLTVGSCLFAQGFPLTFEEDKTYFSVLIQTFPTDQTSEMLRIYEDLKNRGILVYYNLYRTRLPYSVKVGIGKFENKLDAERLGKLFSEFSGIGFSIDSVQINPRSPKFYTALLKTFDGSESREMSSFARKILDLGFFVNRFSSGPRDRSEFKLHAGVFRNITEAAQFADVLKEREGLESAVDTASVKVSEIDDDKMIVTTPNGIWSSSAESQVEIYAFERSNISRPQRRILTFDETSPSISPDKKSIVFFYGSKIRKVTLATKEETILLDLIPDGRGNLMRSFPQWSPSGENIALMDYRAWERISSLWIMKPDGTDLRRIVTGESENSVKNFLWHPSKDEIFFVAGYAMGTVTVGGNLYSVDLDGNRKEIATAEAVNGEEIRSVFRIFGDRLLYQVSHYSDLQKMNIFFTTHEYIIPDINK